MSNCIVYGADLEKTVPLAELVTQYADFKLLPQVREFKTLLNVINSTAIDLLFIFDDIDPISPFDILPLLQKETAVIVISETEKLAFRCFEQTQIIDYLLAPITTKRFLITLSRYHRDLKSQSQYPENHKEQSYLFVNTNKKNKRINFRDILFIESLKDYVTIKTTYYDYIVHSNLLNFTNLLPKHDFIRIHKRFTVAKNQIQSISSTVIEIGAHVLPIGRTYKNRVLQLVTGEFSQENPNDINESETD